jgi:hypothetical protein
MCAWRRPRACGSLRARRPRQSSVAAQQGPQALLFSELSIVAERGSGGCDHVRKTGSERRERPKETHKPETMQRGHVEFYGEVQRPPVKT